MVAAIFGDWSIRIASTSFFVTSKLNPRSTFWNDASAMQGPITKVVDFAEVNAWRTMQLADDHAFGTVDDETRRHRA